jgi:hypothetical protein
MSAEELVAAGDRCVLPELEYDGTDDVWEGSYDKRQIRVSGRDFATRLDDLARLKFDLPWEDLGEEEYIGVLAEARYDMAFWLTRVDAAPATSAIGI